MIGSSRTGEQLGMPCPAVRAAIWLAASTDPLNETSHQSARPDIDHRKTQRPLFHIRPHHFDRGMNWRGTRRRRFYLRTRPSRAASADGNRITELAVPAGLAFVAATLCFCCGWFPTAHAEQRGQLQPVFALQLSTATQMGFALPCKIIYESAFCSKPSDGSSSHNLAMAALSFTSSLRSGAAIARL